MARHDCIICKAVSQEKLLMVLTYTGRVQGRGCVVKTNVGLRGVMHTSCQDVEGVE